MSDPKGSWLGPALALSAKLEKLAPSEKMAVLREDSASRGLSPTTVRRAVLAARYCAAVVAEKGMQVEDIVAATLAIELLMRLENRDRKAANAIRGAVFAGQISVRDLRRRLEATPEKRARGRHMNEWAQAAITTCDSIYSENIKSFAKGEASFVGRALSVDIEVVAGDAVSADAIFLSPLDEFSTSAGLRFEAQIPLILSATLFYPRVNVVVHDPAESLLIRRLIDETRPNILIHIIEVFSDDQDTLEAMAHNI